ncbi:MFS transporter [Streptomyces sp. A012304]|uniref:MFS transporter n=1 Tax=Streptomyces sp. A012304 TaxID=375446 RepID=UPI00222FC3E9|nr:MFS transporter [Streptomyces sp. A012304]GKQ39191.1 MFS transporter [Streptomyces sp. A012304]
MSTLTSEESPPQAERSASRHHHRWLILAVIATAQLMVVLDATIVNIALPSTQAELGFSDDSRQWLVTAYSLAFGSLLLIGGRIADLIGRKAALVVGLVGFAGASALAGAAANFEVLVAGRALQGVFGALLAPTALALLTTTFTDAKERAKAFGIYGAVAGAGGGVGLLLGGVLTEYLNWRWCLYVNLIFAAVALVGAMVLLPRHRRDTGVKIDIPGTVTVTAGLFALVYGFAHAETDGWSSTGTWGFLVAGAALIAVFAWLQTRVAHPLLPLRILRDRDRGAASLAMFISAAGMFGFNLFLTYYLQQTLHYSPVETGLAFLPTVAAVMISSTLATSVLTPRFGPKPIVPFGMVLAAAGLVWLTALETDSTYAAHVLPPLLVFGLGLGLVMAPSMSAATFGIDPADAGVGSASVNTMQQVGGSIGTALLSTLAAGAATDYLAGKAPTPDALAQSALESYSTAYWWSAAFFAAGAILCGLLFRRGVPEHDPDAAPTVHM